ncbi:MAG: hypothetical protein ACRD4O_11695, partial [Bryobacteraceae bacterium]
AWASGLQSRYSGTIQKEKQMPPRMAAWRPGRAAPLGRRERGSALLIVFVFAAILAIMLYREMPVAVFEARRAKEQLLIDRGHEYVRAIQLYYRKFKPRYPPSIEALEDTNRMRFLRHRFKDPFTGKDDWRMIHTNGITLTDSKVKPFKTGTTGKEQSGGNSSSSGWFTNSTSAFGSAPSDDSSASNDQPEVVVPPVRERAPEISANASAADENNPAAAGENPETPLLDASQSGGGLGAPLQADLGSEPGSAAPSAQSSSQQQGSAQGGSNPMQMVRNMLSSEAPLAPQQAGSTMGAVHGGGIAGVASKAGGHSIKVINDQTDYSLWEFVYDPTKDRTGMQPAMGGAQAGGQPQNGGASAAPSQAAQPSGNTPFGNTPFGSESAASPGNGTRMVSPQ